jgi:hypothetical protein
LPAVGEGTSSSGSENVVPMEEWCDLLILKHYDGDLLAFCEY